MYKCDVHGYKEIEWCDECNKLINCDCSTTKTDNGYVEYGNLGRSIQVYIDYYPVCGQVSSVSN